MSRRGISYFTSINNQPVGLDTGERRTLPIDKYSKVYYT